MTTALPSPSKQQLDIAYYIELQRRVFDIFRYVSCHESNFQTYSIVIESVLIDSGSFFDSLCQTFIRTKSTSGYRFKQESQVKDFPDKAGGADNFNFGDYRCLLQTDFALSKKEVILKPYEDAIYPHQGYARDISGYYRIAPFKEWAIGQKSPWWEAFTGLKHDRLKNFRNANLANVICSLAAVFIILTLHNETDFKQGSILLDLYDMFFPTYWEFHGRVTICGYLWK